MSDDVIRIGFVGAGGNTTKRHIPGFQATDGVELVSVANRTRESSQRVADEFGISTVYDGWQDLIAADDTDAICIGTWPNMHHTLVLAALDAGKHVLCEARMAMDSAEAWDMLSAGQEQPDLIKQLVPAPFTLWADKTVKELITNGFTGDLLSVDVALSKGFIDRDALFTWRDDRDVSGNNVMWTGIFYEVLMRLIGPATSVQALTTTNVKWRQDDQGERRYITIPDHVELLCEMAAGPVAHMRVSSVTGLAPEDTIWFYGAEGTLKIDIHCQKLYGARRVDSELSEIIVRPEMGGSWRVEEEFVNAIKGVEEVTHTTFEDGVRYMEFTDAILQSSQSSKKITLPL
ncbi:MAG: Gfo/Idh/MocA family oxidoreductase [SAR202 cluster bacterium]|nr:Gfo/Idh/MocA family oxidoreductase [SAR202 cluster bacterium]